MINAVVVFFERTEQVVERVTARLEERLGREEGTGTASAGDLQKVREIGNHKGISVDRPPQFQCGMKFMRWNDVLWYAVHSMVCRNAMPFKIRCVV